MPPWLQSSLTSPLESLTQEQGLEEDFPLVEEDWLRNCLGKPDIHKSMGPDGSDGSPTNAWGAGRHCSWSIYNHLWKNVVIRRGAWGLKESKCHCGLQNGQKGESRELLASQLHLSPLKGDRMAHPGYCLWACERQEGDKEYWASIHQKEVMLYWTDYLL